MNVLHLRHVVAAALLLAPACVLAVNYPTELHVKVDDSDSGPPTLFVDFMNNEGDPVGFVIEGWKNGVLQPNWPGNGSLLCTKSADDSACDGLPNNRPRGSVLKKGHRAFEVATIDRDTDYCFRIKAVTTDSRNESAWTPQVCARTLPLPRRPPWTPGLPEVTLIDPGTNGRGEPGPAKPGRMLIEWRSDSNDVAWFAIERSDAYAGPVVTPLWQEVGRVTRRQMGNGAGLEFIDAITDPDKMPGSGRRVGYRVCAGNIGGKTCSIATSYPSALVHESVANRPALARTPARQVSAAQAGVPAAMSVVPPGKVPTTAVVRPTPALDWGRAASGAFGATGLRRSP